MVEYLAFNQEVEGSSPSGPTIYGSVAQGLERRSYKAEVEGSIPSTPTTLLFIITEKKLGR